MGLSLQDARFTGGHARGMPSRSRRTEELMKSRFDLPALTLRQAARFAGCSRRYLDLAAQRGELRCVNVPGRRGRFVLPEVLAEFLRPRSVGPK